MRPAAPSATRSDAPHLTTPLGANWAQGLALATAIVVVADILRHRRAGLTAALGMRLFFLLTCFCLYVMIHCGQLPPPLRRRVSFSIGGRWEVGATVSGCDLGLKASTPSMYRLT